MQILLAAFLFGAWLLAVRESGLAGWIALRLGGLSLPVVVALQGVPALLLVAALLRWGGERPRAVGLGPAAPLRTLIAGLITAGACYLALPLVIQLYLAATGRSMADLAAEQLDWLAPFAALPVTLLLPVALFVGLYEEVLFRGFLQSRLMILAGVPGEGGRGRVALVIALSALLFGAGHGYQGPLGIAQTTTIGAILGLSAHLSRSIWPPIVAHVTIDTIGLLAARYLRPFLEELASGALQG